MSGKFGFIKLADIDEMPVIDGVGDEVLQFFIGVLVAIIGILAWLSTNASPDRYRAMIQMHSRGNNAVTVSIRSRHSRISRLRTPTIQPSAINGPRAIMSSPSNQAEARVVPLQEMDSIVDADMAMMNNNRLHFYRRVAEPHTVARVEEITESASDASDTVEESDSTSNAQIREMDSIVSAMEADLNEPPSVDHTASNNDTNATSEINVDTTDSNIKEDEEITVRNEDTDGPSADDEATATAAMEPASSGQRKILIKLKYINDTLKEVEGSLDEPLKDFKCRHFSAELGAQRRVRLIFNGRALLDEAATLRACGLHHRAVVHCLVHSAPRDRHGQSPAVPEGSLHELVSEPVNAERYWDLENILMTLVSLALTVVWFFRCEYSNLFTASASVALFGLTVFYSVAIFGLYLSDTFYFERRPPAPPAH